MPPQRLRARPTTDFAKEGLFNMLQHSVELEEIDVLDLFAGGGGISYEFVSRGARSVVSVDSDRVATGHIEKLAQEVPDSDWHVIKADVFSFLTNYVPKKDIIFADPPFKFGKHAKLVARIIHGGHLKEGGLFIIEHPNDVDLSQEPHFEKSRKYGNLTFSFFNA
jgi:16S rRNA (guanine(966)-N(2))-methyltransferase RsmD